MNIFVFVLTGAVLLGGLLYSLLRALRRAQTASPAVDEQTAV